jgi:hypothetical protein
MAVKMDRARNLAHFFGLRRSIVGLLSIVVLVGLGERMGPGSCRFTSSPGRRRAVGTLGSEHYQRVGSFPLPPRPHQHQTVCSSSTSSPSSGLSS